MQPIKVYIASKPKYAERWRLLAEKLQPEIRVTSRWISTCPWVGGDNALSFDQCVDLSMQCIGDVRACDVLVLYCEPGDDLRGSLIEAGAALGLGKRVYCVGMCDSLSRVFCWHPLWTDAKNMDDAIYQIRFIAAYKNSTQQT